MLAKTNSCAVIGLDGEIVEVEVDISSGLTAFNVVGLAEKPWSRCEGAFGPPSETPATASEQADHGESRAS